MLLFLCLRRIYRQSIPLYGRISLENKASGEALWNPIRKGGNHEKQKNAEKNPDRSWYPCDSMPVGLRGLDGLAIHYGEGYLQ